MKRLPNKERLKKEMLEIAAKVNVDTEISASTEPSATKEKHLTKGVSLPPEWWDILRDVSHSRKKRGIKPSTISAIIQEVLEGVIPNLKGEIDNR